MAVVGSDYSAMSSSLMELGAFIFPDEVWMQIFLTCDAKTLLQVSQVCKKLYNLVSDTSLWLHLFQRYSMGMLPTWIMEKDLLGKFCKTKIIEWVNNKNQYTDTEMINERIKRIHQEGINNWRKTTTNQYMKIYNIVFFGGEGCGVTTAVSAISNSIFDKSPQKQPKKIMDYKKSESLHVIIDQRLVSLKSFDTPTFSRFSAIDDHETQVQSIRREIITKANAVALIFDVRDYHSFLSVEYWANKIRELYPNKLSAPPFILAGAKWGFYFILNFMLIFQF